MERKISKYGKPLPNKSDLKLLHVVDRIIEKHLPSYIESYLDDYYDTIRIPKELEGYDIDELTDIIYEDRYITDRNNSPLYYLFLKQEIEHFIKRFDYLHLKAASEAGMWKYGWIPNLMNDLGLDFEESYVLTILWLNNQLKKYGTSVPEIELAINENNMKNLIKKILKEQIVKNEHSICGILTCNKLDEVLNKIDYNRLTPIQKEKLNKIISNYKRDVSNNLKDVPKNGGLKGATGDSEKDFCDEYLSEIQTLICEPTQE